MSIKKLNDANPTAKRPLRVEDLQDIWSGLCGALSQNGTPRIISGLDISSTGFLTAGCVAYQGDLYFYDGESNIQEGSGLYVARIPDNDDMRTLSDGTIQPFSYLNIVTADSSLAGAVYIGEASRATLDIWRAAIIPDASVGTAKIANEAISSNKLGKSLQPIFYASLVPPISQPSGGSFVGNVFGGRVSSTEYGWEVTNLLFALAGTDGVFGTLRAGYPSGAGTTFVSAPNELPLLVTFSDESVSGDLFIEYMIGGKNRKLTINTQGGGSVLITFRRFGDMSGYVPAVITPYPLVNDGITWADELNE